VRIKEDERFIEKWREVHVAEDGLWICDAPRLVEGRLQHHAAES
jgi:hypothetical protein